VLVLFAAWLTPAPVRAAGPAGHGAAIAVARPAAFLASSPG
jgi:hypothetical protein